MLTLVKNFKNQRSEKKNDYSVERQEMKDNKQQQYLSIIKNSLMMKQAKKVNL